VDCPACYNLVQSAANDHRARLRELEKVLRDIASSPTVISDEDFEKKLQEVQRIVEGLWNEARHGAGGMTYMSDGSVTDETASGKRLGSNQL
jgi:coxsackievirus/adenovirus receptor